MVSVLLIYVMMVILFARRLVAQIELRGKWRLAEERQTFQGLQAQKKSLSEEKIKLEEEAIKIFVLYELTKETTKSVHEEEAFEIFKQKLKEHVSFRDCRLFDPASEEIEHLKQSEEYFVFALCAKRRRMGFLAVQEVPDEDKEKLMILSHQFALVLRRVRLYQEIEKIAITDSLTEVHTRRYLLERFKEEIQRSRMRRMKASFLMIDVDHFKKFNDSYGHLAGDLVLREIAGIIKENIREIDIAGRYGGEEFCVVLPDTGRQGAIYAAERIRLASEKTPIKAYDAKITATVSIGVSTFPEDGEKTDELIDKADWALYRAKKQGRNKVCSFGIYEG